MTFTSFKAARISGRFGIFLSCLTVLCFAGTAAAQNSPFSAPAPVTVTTSQTSVAAGSNVVVDVNVDLTGITGVCNGASTPAVLGGYAIPVNFDRSRLEFLSSAACTSPQFSNPPTTTNVANANATGTVSVAASQTNQTAPTGRVCVARLTFRASSSGTASVTPGGSISLSSAFQSCPTGGSGGPSTIASTATGLNVSVSDTATSSIIPVVASAPGAFGSFFKTAFQIHNPSSAAITGRLVFHRQGVAGSGTDPFLNYTLAPNQTLFFADLLPAMGQSGLGSLDLVAVTGRLPVTVARIFNDAGSLGTTGFAEDQVIPDSAIRAGERAVLIAPPDQITARLNIGVRSLSSGATFRVTVLSKDGAVLGNVTKTYAPTYFEQVASPAFLGITLTGNETLQIQMDSGSAVIYGSTTDNITQDPSLQLAKRVS